MAYEAGCISSTNSDSPASAIEPSLFRLIRNACWGSSMVMISEASTCGRTADDAAAPSDSSTAVPAARTSSIPPWISR
jgi:hypothetical protein